jgi:hypothetical protein
LSLQKLPTGITCRQKNLCFTVFYFSCFAEQLFFIFPKHSFN